MILRIGVLSVLLLILMALAFALGASSPTLTLPFGQAPAYKLILLGLVVLGIVGYVGSLLFPRQGDDGQPNVHLVMLFVAVLMLLSAGVGWALA